MIEFETLRWKNFLSTGDEFIEISLNSDPSTLVVGENGSGKSTLLDALTFVLFSKPFRRINKPQLINSVNERGCLVEIEFVVGSKSYFIRRGMKPNLFEIYVNGEIVDQDSTTRDYQEHLEKYILKLNYKSFTQIILLGSSSFQPFMQLTTANRREVIEDLLDINVFSTMNQLLREKFAINKNDLLFVDQRIEVNNERIDMQQGYISEVEEINRNKIEKTQRSIDNSKSQIDGIDLALLDQRKELDDLMARAKDYDLLTDRQQSFKLLGNQISSNIRKMKKDVKFFEDNDDCPTCGQKLDENHTEHIVEEKTSKLKESVDGLEKLEIEMEGVNKSIKNISEILGQANEKELDIQKNRHTIDGIEKYIQKMDEEIQYLNKVKEKADGDAEKLNAFIEKKLEMESEKEELAIENQYLSLSFELLKDTGIKTRIIRQYLPIMNNQVNKYLTAMDSYFNFTIDENFNESIKSRYRDEFSYDSFSEGEKMRIDLALLFTWRAVAKMKNSASTNLLILDEVFDSSLDANGTDEFLKLLQSLGLKSNVFVISHKGDTLYEKFDNVIKFDKVQNFSKVV